MENLALLKGELKSLIEGSIKDIDRFDNLLRKIEDIRFNEGADGVRNSIKELLEKF